MTEQLSEDDMPYEAFVASRIKWLDSPAADILHASVGIVGELIELEFATDVREAHEELGDIGFYMEHLRQVFWKNESSPYFRLMGEPPTLLSAGECLTHMRFHAGSILDIGKKLWVYNKPFEGPLRTDIRYHLARLEEVYTCLLDFQGVKESDLRLENQAKLMLRYPKGYSDADAQARKDKENGN